MNTILIKIAGILNLLTAFVHLIPGQLDLATPLLNSNLSIQQKGELIAVWHIITILLFMTSFFILQEGFRSNGHMNKTMLKSIALFYILISLPFMVSSVIYSIMAPQWILLLPIGILIYLSIYKMNRRHIKT